MAERLVGPVITVGILWGVASLLGWWFPWTSTVIGVLLVLMAIAGIFDPNARKEAGMATIAALIFFGCMLFRAGRAEVRSSNEKIAQSQNVNEQLAAVETVLAQDKFDEALRLVSELESKVTKDRMQAFQVSRLDAIKTRAESEAKLRPARIKEANERVSQLVASAKSKLIAPNSVSEESERIISEAFAIRLATHLAAAREVANDLVRRRVSAAKTLLDNEQLDDARLQIQAAQAVVGATEHSEAKQMGAVVANRLLSKAVETAHSLIESGDTASAETQVRSALDQLPEATDRTPASTLLAEIPKEKIKAANTRVAELVSKGWGVFAKDEISNAEEFLKQARAESSATEWVECDKLEKHIKDYHAQKRAYEIAAIARKRDEELRRIETELSKEQAGGRKGQRSGTTTRKWYEGGTLHDKMALDWQDADEHDKLATCADFVAAIWDKKRFSPKIQNSIRSIDDLKPYARELRDCLDAATQKDPNPKRNKSTFTNQSVKDFAAAGMILMNWTK